MIHKLDHNAASTSHHGGSVAYIHILYGWEKLKLGNWLIMYSFFGEG